MSSLIPFFGLISHRSIAKLSPPLNAIALQNLSNNATHNVKMQQRNYKNFGHARQDLPSFTKFWYFFVFIGLILPSINWAALGADIYEEGEDQHEKQPEGAK